MESQDTTSGRSEDAKSLIQLWKLGTFFLMWNIIQRSGLRVWGRWTLSLFVPKAVRICVHTPPVPIWKAHCSCDPSTGEVDIGTSRTISSISSAELASSGFSKIFKFYLKKNRDSENSTEGKRHLLPNFVGLDWSQTLLRWKERTNSKVALFMSSHVSCAHTE